jgi:GNAT superfamily N-acetyltransferase
MTASTRLARNEDVAALVDLMAAFYSEAGFSLPAVAARQTFSALLRDPRLGRVWLIESDRTPVGYVVVTVAFSMEFGGLRGFIDDFFVLPAARNKGVGAAALETVKQACRELGLCALLVETGPDDHPARSIYARAGFEPNDRVLLSMTLSAPLHEQ